MIDAGTARRLAATSGLCRDLPGGAGPASRRLGQGCRPLATPAHPSPADRRPARPSLQPGPSPARLQYQLGEGRKPRLYNQAPAEQWRRTPPGERGHAASTQATAADLAGARAVCVGWTAMPDVIAVTPENIDRVLADLPRLARLALGFGARLRRGTLDVTLPDGRVVRLGGAEPGPAAAMMLSNYGFATRLINGGDIGIAEAYLNGDWDTPDLTQFLYLFCVNQELLQGMLADKPFIR